MITEERFEEIVNKLAAGDGLSSEEGTELVQSLAELDQRGLIAESVVHFVLEAAEQIYNEVAEGVVREMNLRDHAKVKRVLSIGTKAAAQLTSITQLYIAQLYLQMQQGAEEDVCVPETSTDSTPS